MLDQEGDIESAETALQTNYGLGRKLYERAGGVFGVNTVYVEITAA